MSEVWIKYKDHKTLQFLKDIAKYFNFTVIVPDKNKKSEEKNVNGVTILSGDKSIDTSGLKLIFSKKSLDSKELRRRAWQRS